MNTLAIDKIRSRYNAEHDMGPDAPIHWSVMELAELVSKLIDRVDELEEQLNPHDDYGYAEQKNFD